MSPVGLRWTLRRLCLLVLLLSGLRVGATEYGVFFRSKPLFVPQGGREFLVEIPAVGGVSMSSDSGFACSVEAAARVLYSYRGPHSSRRRLVPESATLSLRWQKPTGYLRTSAGIAYSVPGRVLSPIVDGKVLDHQSYHLVSGHIALTRIFDPGALSGSLQWVGGIPRREREVVWYRPGQVSGTLLLTEALHPDLALSIGFRRNMNFPETLWPHGVIGAPEIGDEVLFVVQTGSGSLHLRAVADIAFVRDGAGFSLTLEAERYEKR